MGMSISCTIMAFNEEATLAEATDDELADPSHVAST